MLRIAFAEKEGFEPPDLLQSTVFKTAAFDHSAISPVSYANLISAGLPAEANLFAKAGANIESFFLF